MLSRGAERLLDLLRWHHSRFRRITPKQKDLAGHLGVTMRQIRRYLTELAGLVTVRKCGRDSAEYVLSAEAFTVQNVRSKSGLCPVEVRSVPYVSSNQVKVPISLHTQRKSPRKALYGMGALQAMMDRYEKAHGL